jgi:signal transduction histidine kinase
VQSLIYRLMVVPLTLFVVGTLTLLIGRHIFDPQSTPYHALRLALGVALDVEDSPEELQTRLERLNKTLNARITLYTPSGELLATSVDPPLALPERDFGIFGGYQDLYNDAGEHVARQVTAPPLELFGRQLRDVLLAWLLICVATIFVSLRAARRLASPLLAVEAAARRLGEGDLDARVDPRRLRDDPTTAELGHAFNLMAERLSLALRSQRELLASVSHEFRTPLARMRVVSEMLADGDDARELLPELLPELDTDIGELERLVSRVLEAARCEAEARRVSAGDAPAGPRIRISSAALIDRIAGRFALVHPERALAIEAAPEVEVEVEVEVEPLLRAFDNLLENAHRYSDPQATITLRATADAAALRLAVVDRGVGIASEDLALIFNPFFRADRSRARHSGGLGLGLATSRCVVETQGGELRVDSAIGEGSTFSVVLPRVGARRSSRRRGLS